jgi:hypothetical protein
MKRPITEHGTITGYSYGCRCVDCREIKSEWAAAYRQEHKAETRAYSHEHKAERNAESRAAYVKLRKRILAHYGTECAYCGSTDHLQIDHMDGNGGDHRMELFGARRGFGGAFYYWLARNNFPDGYQILCRYHNAAKSDTPDAEYRRKLGLAA